jgi:hypothetical protein
MLPFLLGQVPSRWSEAADEGRAVKPVFRKYAS